MEANVKYNKEVYKAIALITQLGLSMLAPILICAFLGSFLEHKWNISLFIPLLIIGILAGYRNCYILVKKLLDNKKDRK